MHCACLVAVASTDDNEVRLFRCNGPAVLVGVMDLHKDSPSIQEAASGVLRSIAFRGSDPSEGKALTVAIPSLIGALQRHPDNRALAETVVGALRNLSAERTSARARGRGPVANPTNAVPASAQ